MSKWPYIETPRPLRVKALSTFNPIVFNKISDTRAAVQSYVHENLPLLTCSKALEFLFHTLEPQKNCNLITIVNLTKASSYNELSERTHVANIGIRICDN